MVITETSHIEDAIEVTTAKVEMIIIFLQCVIMCACTCLYTDNYTLLQIEYIIACCT